MMENFNQQTNDSLENFTPEASANYYGIALPQDLLLNKVKLEIDGAIIQPIWWQQSKPEDFQVVGLYSDVNNKGFGEGKAYLFAIKDQVPEIYLTMQNQGNEKGTLVFSKVDDPNLTAEFSKVISE